MPPDPATNPSTIAARRHRALVIIRWIELVLGLLGSIALCYQLGLMAAMQDLMGWSVMWGDTSWFAWAMGLLIPAATLYVCDRRIVRWLIPVPGRECHECGYPLRGLSPSATRCPECGTAITATSADAAGPARK